MEKARKKIRRIRRNSFQLTYFDNVIAFSALDFVDEVLRSDMTVGSVKQRAGYCWRTSIGITSAILEANLYIAQGELPCPSRLSQSLPFLMKRCFHMFGALAEFERNLIRERTQAGLQAARARGRKGGRQQKLTA
ncbi:recombinase family protein [Leptolyngbya sp. FACHB-711]|nr:recombinase family protein [Leptolyngbya sp. FACHB-711]